MDMNNDTSRAANDFFNDPGKLGGKSSAFSGLPDGSGGLVTRSIWSAGTGNLPAPISQVSSQQRPSSGQQTRLGGQTASAEALFNSMPNQNQHNNGSNRSSPNMAGSAILDPLKRSAFSNAEVPAVSMNGQHDIWNPPSPRGLPLQDARTQHGAIRGPYHQVTRQHG